MRQIGHIGLLGGSFDPPHQGHIYISRKAIKLLKLEKIYWDLTKINPLIKKKYFYTYNERWNLCKKKIKKIKKIQMLNFTNKFSYQTLKKLKKLNPNKKIFFVIGSDNIFQLHKWKQLSYIKKNSTIAVIERPGYSKLMKKTVFFKKNTNYIILKKFDNSLKINQNQWVYLKIKGVNFSSSKIKNRLYKFNNN